MATEIRPIEREEVVDYLRVLPFANGLPSWEPAPAAWHGGPEPWPPNKPASMRQMEASADEVMGEHFHPQAAFVDGKLVGATAMISFEITVPGERTVAMGGVTGTGVIATHRRRGLLRRMMQAMFEEALERGEPLAGLSASEGSIYGRFGFSPATMRTRWELERAQAQLLPGRQPVGALEIVEAGTARREWPTLHAATRRIRVGELSPQPEQWAGLSDDADGTAGPLRYLLHRDDAGIVDGIANYRLPWSSTAEDVGTLIVENLWANTTDAYRAMWGLLLDFDLTRKVVAVSRPLDEPLRWMLQNPRAMRITRQSDNLWLRLLDVHRALEARTYQTTGTLTFGIKSDPVCPHNEGTWRLEGGPDGAQCTKVTGDPDLSLDLQALATFYLGGMSAHLLAQAGRITAASPSTIRLLSRMFRTDPEPHNSFGF